MDRIRKTDFGSKVITIIDYRGLNPANMSTLVSQLAEQIAEENQPVFILSIFNEENFATPMFMRTVEEATRRVEKLIMKQAIVGLNATKRMILKGYNVLFDTNIPDFEGVREAMEFLADDRLTDRGNPWRSDHAVRWRLP